MSEKKEGGTTKEPSPEPRRKFQLLSHSEQEDNEYDYVAHRNIAKPCSVLAGVAHLAKGALGSGILSGHVAYKFAGLAVGLIFNALLGFFMAYCFYRIGKNAQILYRRTRTPVMTYPDVGEAACSCCSHPFIKRLAKPFRYAIDVTICMDLFGSCATYQIIAAKTIKQLVEDTQETAMEPLKPGYPGLRIYLLCVIPIFVLICLLRHLKYLAPFSLAANGLVVVCVCTVFYYCMITNPGFEHLIMVKDFSGFFQFCGMCIFSMSCVGIVLPVENSLKDPRKFGLTLTIGMCFVVSICMVVSFFGYVAYHEDSKSPITLNFPMTVFPKILKVLIILMIIATHGLNFWVPFSVVFHYISKKHSPDRVVFWEFVYRILFVLGIGTIAIVFPSITALSGFIGAFCLCNMAFIWPNLIELMVHWERPGLGTMKWRLWKCSILIILGLFLFVNGTVVNSNELIIAFTSGEKV